MKTCGLSWFIYHSVYKAVLIISYRDISQNNFWDANSSEECKKTIKYLDNKTSRIPKDAMAMSCELTPRNWNLSPDFPHNRFWLCRDHNACQTPVCSHYRLTLLLEFQINSMSSVSERRAMIYTAPHCIPPADFTQSSPFLVCYADLARLEGSPLHACCLTALCSLIVRPVS